MGTLYLVGTPIGNLEDTSERALRILRQVDCIASENPSRTKRLLARYAVRTPLIRYTDAYDRKKRTRMKAVLTALGEGDVALVSEAGMPGVADPGFELVNAARDLGARVVPVPGPTAIAAALSIAGMRAEAYIFLGFLPRAKGPRRKLLASVRDNDLALVAYESPHRLVPTLADLAHTFGDRPMVAACELTKLYEGVIRGTPSEVLAHFEGARPRGEFTLVISPTSSPPGLVVPSHG